MQRGATVTSQVIDTRSLRGDSCATSNAFKGGNRDERSNHTTRDTHKGGRASGGSIRGALERARPRAPASGDRRALDRGRVADPPATAGDPRDGASPGISMAATLEAR